MIILLFISKYKLCNFIMSFIILNKYYKYYECKCAMIRGREKII